MIALTDKELGSISTGPKTKHFDSNAKTVEALSILGAGKPHGSALGYKGRAAHDTKTFAEDSN